MANKEVTEAVQGGEGEEVPQETNVLQEETEEFREETEAVPEEEVQLTQELGGGAENPAGPSRRDRRTLWQRIKRAVYNPDTGAILGRTCASWGRLGLFYAIFYGVLSSVFGISMEVLLRTMNLNEPKWKLGESLIGTNPGLGFRPISPDTVEGALIWYNYKKPASTDKWVKLLDEFLEPYRRNYTEPHMKFCDFSTKFDPNAVCFVDVDHFGPCTSQNKYGYNGTSPCVFIKLNKIFGWVPEFYTEPVKGMPSDLAEEIKSLPMSNRSQVWITCNGENPVDRENVRAFKYYPARGLPGYYYPYVNKKNYLSPLIAVQIVDPTPNILINVECRIWAKNVLYKRSKLNRQGSVHFEILKDNK